MPSLQIDVPTGCAGTGHPDTSRTYADAKISRTVARDYCIDHRGGLGDKESSSKLPMRNLEKCWTMSILTIESDTPTQARQVARRTLQSLSTYARSPAPHSDVPRPFSTRPLCSCSHCKNRQAIFDPYCSQLPTAIRNTLFYSVATMY
jgi:hypothetical protein